MVRETRTRCTKVPHLYCLVAASIVASCTSSGDESAIEKGLDYPDAQTGQEVDIYHGVLVGDPYRWLEDPSSPETEAFLGAQDSLARAYLDGRPEREIVRRRLAALNDYDLYRPPQRAGDRYFFLHRQGLENQPVLHMASSLSGPSEILVDPNVISADGTVSLHYSEASNDGRRVLYTLSKAGSDWREVRVRDVASREDLDDRIQAIHTFSSLAWAHDGSGFYYARPSTPASVAGSDLALEHSTVLFHRLGDEQAQDRIVYERPDEPGWWLGATPTSDGRYLLISAWESFRIAYLIKDLQADGAVRPLIPNPDAATQFVGNDGSRFWFLTDRDAPRRRLVEIEADSPDDWKDIIPEGRYALQDVRIVGSRFVARYLRDAHTEIRLFNFDGSDAGAIDLPTLGGGSHESAV